MFVPIPLTFLRELRDRHREEIEAIEETYVALGPEPERRLPARNAVAISVFCAHRMNRYADEFPMDEKTLGDWLKSYADPLTENLARFPELFDTNEWKVIAYVCPTTLEKLKPTHDIVAELTEYPFVELQIMKHPSIGHSPGALWRLLSMSDTSLDELLIYDIDEPWALPINRWHGEARTYDWALARGVHMPRDGFWVNLEVPWQREEGMNNYPPILCSKLNVRPLKLGIPDMSELISSYVFLRMRQSKTSNPVSQLHVSEPVTPFNRPTPLQPFGQRNHWYQYCFDERFLKHVIFPYAVEEGLVCTWCLPQDITDNLATYFARPTLRDFQADFRFTQRSHPNNVIVNNHRVVKEEI